MSITTGTAGERGSDRKRAIIGSPPTANGSPSARACAYRTRASTRFIKNCSVRPLASGQVRGLDVAGEHAGVVRAIPGHGRRGVEEAHPERDRARGRIARALVGDEARFERIADDPLVDGTPPRRSGADAGVRRVEHPALYLPPHERQLGAAVSLDLRAGRGVIERFREPVAFLGVVANDGHTLRRFDREPACGHRTPRPRSIPWERGPGKGRSENRSADQKKTPRRCMRFRYRVCWIASRT